MNDNRNQASDGEAKAKPEVIKLGLNLHAQGDHPGLCSAAETRSRVDQPLIRISREIRGLTVDYDFGS